MPITKEQFAELIPKHQKQLRAFIRRKVRGDHEADDITQDSILIGYKKIESLKDPDKLLPWLKSIATNKINDYFNQNRKVIWSDLIDQVEAAPEEDKGNLMKDFDSMFQLLAKAGVSDTNLLTTALYFCLNWPAKQIATVLGVKEKTVYWRIKHTEKKLAGKTEGGATLQAHQDCSLKLKLATFFTNASIRPPEGAGYRNAYFLREAYALVRLTSLQYPDNKLAAFQAYKITFTFTIMSQYNNDFESNKIWRRDKFDQEALKTAVQQYQRLNDFPLKAEQRYVADYYNHILIQKHNKDVDWAYLLDLCEKAIEINPLSSTYFRASFCIDQLYGPLKAAAFLEKHKNISVMRDLPNIYQMIADFYFEGGNYRKARLHYKKVIKWSTSKEREERTKNAIALCTTEIKKETKKKPKKK